MYTYHTDNNMSNGLQGTSTKILEYIWTDHKGHLRSKTKIHYDNNEEMFVPPKWVYDGSSTGQAVTENSEVVLNPVQFYNDPFRPDHQNAFLVLCDTELSDGEPHPDNYRRACEKLLKPHDRKEKPLFGFEQEFFIIDTKTDLPILYSNEKRHVMQSNSNDGQYWSAITKGSAVNGPDTQGPYYCGVGSYSVGYRKAINRTLDHCLAAGLSVTGMNFEVAPGQCEIQVCAQGIRAADQLLVLRYIIQRTLESYGLYADFRTKPLTDPSTGKKFNASGCHANFSTEAMRRKPGGLAVIYRTIEAFRDKHSEHIKEYGPGNRKRLIGSNETSSYSIFSWGVADRAASIRIPLQVQQNGCGYFEDRRPSSAMNPYRVVHRMFQTYLEANTTDS